MVYLQINKVKYVVDWEITIIYEKLQDILNSLISVFHPFANICLYSIKFETIRFIGIQIQLVQ